MTGVQVPKIGLVLRSISSRDATTTDRELLRRFAEDNDQSAFAVLVDRHAGMVQGVCRRSLPTVQDAEDACQATFVVLARKAKEMRWQSSVANWLYTTARRVARNVRLAGERRARREARAAMPEAVHPADRMTARELLATLDEELDKLPPRYREPLVLCYLEGLTQERAATRLGIPVATLNSRVERGRKRLHLALTRGGVGLGAGLLALAASSAAGASPSRLVQTVRAAVARKAPPAVAARVAVTGIAKKSLLGVVAFVALEVGVGIPRTSTAGAQPEKPPSRPVKTEPRQQAAPDDIVLAGRVVDTDDRPVSGAMIRVVPRARRGDKVGTVVGPVPTVANGYYDVRIPRAKLVDQLTDEEVPLTVLAVAPGFFPGWTDATADGRIVLATADEKVAGRVTNLEGKPAAGVTIRVTAVAAPTGNSLDPWLETLRRERERSAGQSKLGPWINAAQLPGVSVSAKTNAAGRFELAGYPRDRALHATIEGPSIATSTVGLIARDIGPAALPGSAGIVYHGTNGVIAAKPSRPITGVVRDRDTGKPIPGVTIQSLVMAGSSILMSGLVRTTSGPDGTFTLVGMPKGAGNELLVVPGRGQPYLDRSVAVPDAGGFDPVLVEVVLDKGIVIEGVVQDSAGRPIANTRVAYLANRFNDRVLSEKFGGRSGTTTPTDADGRFQVVGLPGTGYIVAIAPDQRYLAATERTGDGSRFSVSLETVGTPGRADQYHAVYAIDVPRKATEFRQKIVLEQGTNVRVTVVDTKNNPVTGCCSLWSRSGDEWRDEIRPGEHRIEAVNPKQPRAVLFRDLERNLVGALTLPVGVAETTHRLTLRAGVTLTGRVLSDDGRPRVGVAVSVFVRPGKDNSADARRFRHLGEKIVTDTAGRFQILAVVPGFTYEVTINGQFVEHSTVELDSKVTGTKDIGDLRLRMGED
jgi:RNA polymerase sigma factor (sigma-70 family)